MTKSIFNILFLLLIGYSILSLLIFLLQKKLVYFPTRQIHSDPSMIGLDFEEVFIPVKKEKIHSWYIPAENSKYTVIFFHGNGGNISHRLDTILNIVNEFHCSLLIFDYRGYGKSTGNISENNTYEDALSVYDFLINEKKTDPASIIMWGRSLGGAVATDLALRHSPKALILESTFSSLPDMGAHLYPFLPTKFLCSIQYDSFNKINKINCPKLFIHSPQDDIVPFKLGKKLYERAISPKTFVEIHGDHNNGFIDSGDQYIDPINSFLSKL